jgi:hypothetical protein
VAPITATIVRIGALKQMHYAGASTGMLIGHLECLCFGHVERGQWHRLTQIGRAAACSVLPFSIHTYPKKNAESVIAASKETGLEVNVDKTKYIVTSPDHVAGRRV